MKLLELRKEGLEFSLEEYAEIDIYCKTLNIDWFVSCWDIQSQEEMKSFNTPYNKIASAMATNWDFVNFVATEKKTYLCFNRYDGIRAN